MRKITEPLIPIYQNDYAKYYKYGNDIYKEFINNPSPADIDTGLPMGCRWAGYYRDDTIKAMRDNLI